MGTMSKTPEEKWNSLRSCLRSKPGCKRSPAAPLQLTLILLDCSL